MSLSKPINPPFVATAVVAPVEHQNPVPTSENQTRINQIHGIAANNANGAGIPKQVSSVQCSIGNAQTGSTCTVAVTFRVDPTDTNFAGVNIWVKGYQGNRQLVKVGGGTSSPTTFVLNNSGETVSFTIQAYGNGGGAPLTQAPTCSGTLPKSSSGGFGTTTVTSAPTGLTMPPEFTVSGSGSPTIVVGKANEKANFVWAGPRPFNNAAAQPTFRFLAPPDIPYHPIYAAIAGNTAAYQTTGTSVATSGTLSLVGGTSTQPPMILHSAVNTLAGTQTGVTLNMQQFTVGSILELRCRCQFTTATAIRVYIGFVDQSGPLSNTTLNADTFAQNFVGFNFSTVRGDTNWQLKACTDATHNSLVNSGVVFDTAVHMYVIRWDGTNFNFYIDDVFVGSVSSNLPLGSTLLNPMINQYNVTAGNTRNCQAQFISLKTI